MLTKRTKWFEEERTIAVGDLVLIVDDGSRNSWIRGRVLEVLPGQDGRVRQAILKTARGCVRRSVAKLARLDVVNDGKTGTGGQPYGGEDVAAGNTGPLPPLVVQPKLNHPFDLSARDDWQE